MLRKNPSVFSSSLRILGMSWGVKTTCFKAPGVLLGGSGVSIGGVRILRGWSFKKFKPRKKKHLTLQYNGCFIGILIMVYPKQPGYFFIAGFF